MQPYMTFGASPRASINLILAARALAFVRGRSYALPQDVLDMALDVMRHRLVLSYEALSDNVSSRRPAVAQNSEPHSLPEVPLHERANARILRLNPRRARSCSAWTGRSSAAWMACCRATIAACSTAMGWTLPTCANTSRATTSATSTGT
jgi:hypothetical protein